MKQLSLRLTAGAAVESIVNHGIGWNWFDHLGSGGLYANDPTYRMDKPLLPPLSDTAAWEQVKLGLDELKPGFIRFGLPPDVHVAADGSFIANSDSLDRLVWLDRWATANDCTILLDTFTIPVAYEATPRPDRGKYDFLIMAPADNDDYAKRFVVPLLDHIVNRLKLRSVRYFNPVNETLSNGVFRTPPGGPVPLYAYIDMYRAMRQHLDAVGLSRETIGLVGMDSLSEKGLYLLDMAAEGIDIDPYVDAYSIHYYCLRLDYLPPCDHSWTTPMTDVVRNTEALIKYCRRRGKPLLVGEMGTFHYGWKRDNPVGTASADATLTCAEAVIRLMGIGIGSVAFWDLFDVQSNDGWWAAMGIEQGKLVRHRHTYFMYRILTNLIRPGSTVYPLVCNPFSYESNVHGLAIKTPAGKQAILIVNDHPVYNAQLEVSLPEGFAPCRWDVRITDKVRLDAPLPAVETSADGKLRTEVYGFSLTGFTQDGFE